MTASDLVAQQFEAYRPHLRSVAFRMLGSQADAEDAVQEAWLRVSRAETDAVENFGGWLTTIVSRICLDVLRRRSSRREELAADEPPEPANDADDGDPVRDVLLADTMGPALLVVLELLAPAERLAFVLHDMFGVPFEEIAPIIDRTPAAARQLASRARRRVQGADVRDGEPARQRAIVEAFLAASRDGRFDDLVTLLDPSAVFRADTTAVAMGSDAELVGASVVAQTFSGRAKAARLTLIDGAAGAVWSMGGTPKAVFVFTTEGGRVTAIELVADPQRISTFVLAPAE